MAGRLEIGLCKKITDRVSADYPTIGLYIVEAYQSVNHVSG